MLYHLLPFIVGTGPRVLLSGSTGSPNTDIELTSPPTEAKAGWRFLSTGDAVKWSGSAHSTAEWYGILGQTEHSTPDATYYIRFTDDAGAGDNAPDGGSALGSWLSLASTQDVYWSTTGGTSKGQVKVEIATDSGGTNIIATGYYRGYAESTS